MIRVLLSLDLIEASQDQRNSLYEILEEKNWKKTDHVDTVWTLTYTDYNHDLEENHKKIRDYLANVLCNAAKEFKLKEIHYVAQLGNHSVISRTIKKVDGIYKVTVSNLYPKE